MLFRKLIQKVLIFRHAASSLGNECGIINVTSLGLLMKTKNEKFPIATFVVVVLLAILFSGCSVVTVSKEAVDDKINRIQQSALTGGDLSIVSAQYFRLHNLNPEEASSSEELFEKLKATNDSDTLTKQFAIAEFALKTALELEKDKPAKAADWYLLAAQNSYDGLFKTVKDGSAAFDFRASKLRLFYARATAGFVTSLQSIGKEALSNHTRKLAGIDFQVSIAEGDALLDPQQFDKLMLSFEFNFDGLTNHYNRYGLGVAFVGYNENKLETEIDRFYPKVGITRALSVLLTFENEIEDGKRNAQLSFYHSVEKESVEIEGNDVPLAADFTAPFGLLLSKVEQGDINIMGTTDVSEEDIANAGFKLVEPFDPNRIPIITVHGLLSSPLTWIDVHNDLMGDPYIRKHYQIWHFSYPPGLPVLHSAQIFRQKLDELYFLIDPKEANGPLTQTILISHSMGGLLSKTAISDSGNSLWDSTFSVPIDELELSAEDRKQIKSLAFFEKKPYIKRVVFISVPHRGSDIADSFIGKLGRALITAPIRTLRLANNLRKAAVDKIRPDAAESVEEDGSSVKSLSPNNPIIKALAEITIDENIPFHSIIGDQGLGGGENSSDGVVPYKSSHLEGADSELIVPASHGAHHHPLAVLELKRILKLHLETKH